MDHFVTLLIKFHQTDLWVSLTHVFHNIWKWRLNILKLSADKHNEDKQKGSSGYKLITFKEMQCRFEEIQTQIFNIYNINEATIQTQKY